jgi:N-acetyl-anhydromuramyl-L-alanine amidase AmpD
MSVPKPHIEFVGTNGYNISPGAKPALAIVNHIMEGSMQSCIAWFQNPQAGASSNYGIGKDGRIVCFVDPEIAWPYWAWANGVLAYPDATVQALVAHGRQLYGNVSPNVYTISIEHEGHTGEPPSQAMAAATAHLAAYLCEQFHVPSDRTALLGHYQFDSVNRARCPGWSAAFWDEYVRSVCELLYPVPAPPIVDPALDERKWCADAEERIHRAKADLDAALQSLELPPPPASEDEITKYARDALRRVELAQGELVYATQSLTW